jgi:uroporphyrinogen decarboxylase
MFAERVVPLLAENIALQFAGGADLVMVLDTAAGELDPLRFAGHVQGDLATLAHSYAGRLGYFAKHLRPEHHAGGLDDLPWAGLGLGTSADLFGTVTNPQRRGFVQGNFDPESLLGDRDTLTGRLDAFLRPLQGLSAEHRRGWICGLGHGVLPSTPESNVRLFVDRVREAFA